VKKRFSFLRVFLLGCFLWLSYQAGYSLYEYHKLVEKRSLLEREIYDLRIRKALLESRKEFLKTERGIRLLLRKRIGFER